MCECFFFFSYSFLQFSGFVLFFSFNSDLIFHFSLCVNSVALLDAEHRKICPGRNRMHCSLFMVVDFRGPRFFFFFFSHYFVVSFCLCTCLWSREFVGEAREIVCSRREVANEILTVFLLAERCPWHFGGQCPWRIKKWVH